MTMRHKIATRMPISLVAVQQARAADRLDQGDFGSQKRQKGFPDLLMLYLQPPAERQAVVRMLLEVTDW
jgi:hypothetical protein